MTKIIIDKIEVNLKVVTDTSKKSKAIGTLTLGCFKIKGWRIMPSKEHNPLASGEYLWVTPPAYFTGRWHTIFFCEDKDIWKKIEVAFLKKYKEELLKIEIPTID